MCAGGPEPWDGTPGPVSPPRPPALMQALPDSQDDYIKSWEDNQPGDEGTAGMGLGWSTVGSVSASMAGRRVVALSPCTPRVFPSARSGAGLAASREAAAGAGAAAQLRLNGALCRAGWRPALPGSPGASPSPQRLSAPSPGHHQGPLPEGEVQPAQGVRGAGLPARHVHQPQEAGAQVGAGPGPGGGKGGPRRGLSTSRPCRIKPLSPKAHGGCKPCHAAPLAAVCGSDGHTYSSAVRTGHRRGDGAAGPPRVPPPADVPLPPRSASWSSRRAWPASS